MQAWFPYYNHLEAFCQFNLLRERAVVERTHSESGQVWSSGRKVKSFLPGEPRLAVTATTIHVQH